MRVGVSGQPIRARFVLRWFGGVTMVSSLRLACVMLIAFWVVAAATAVRADPPPGDSGFRLSTADHSSAALALADAAADAAPPAENQPATTEPAEEESPAWPPGLLMDGLNAIGFEKVNPLKLRFYGWVESGFTGILTGPGSSRAGLPLRVFESRRPDNLLLNQLLLTMDRPIDTTKAFDWGGRFDLTYGADPTITHAYGLFDKQTQFNQIDFKQFYGEMWLKTGGDGTGLHVMFGRWVTTIGSEVIAAPENYLYSRSYLFGYAQPATHTGLKLTYFFDPNNYAYFAVVQGWDNFEDNNDGKSFMGGFQLASKSLVGELPKTQVLINTIVGPELSGSGWPGNRFLLDVVWIWRWTEKLTQNVNVDYGYQDDAPGAINSEGVSEVGDATWYGVSYMLNYVFNDYVNATGRAEWFRDGRGYRTGYPGNFFEVTTGVAITPFPNHRYLKDLTIRPEIRCDWSANNAPFAEDMQMTAGIDLVYKF